MNRRQILVATAALLAMPSIAFAEDLPTAEAILDGIDKNMTFDSRTTTTKMTVVTSRRTREFDLKSFGKGESHAAIEYLAPTREKGTKMLRIDGDMWMFLPAVERTQKISGHMLRQGMMGSDVSYEDMTAASDLRSVYDAKVLGTEEVNGRKAYKLELTAKNEEVTYPKRTSWVDTETFIPLKQELYALSGMLLKTWEMSEIKEFEGGRKFPMKMVISDKLQEGTHTTLAFTDMSFGVALEDEVFSMRWLERK